MSQKYKNLIARPAIEDGALGPLISKRQKSIVEGFIDKGQNLSLVAQGDIHSNAPSEGHYVAPRLFAESNKVHWLGTDHFGRDILSMIMIGARTSLAVALLAVQAIVCISSK